MSVSKYFALDKNSGILEFFKHQQDLLNKNQSELNMINKNEPLTLL